MIACTYIALRSTHSCLSVEYRMPHTRHQNLGCSFTTACPRCSCAASSLLPPSYVPVLCAQDVYSFGIVMWELWTLREPFEGINYHALLHMMSTTAEGVRPPLPGMYGSV